ncbi:Fur-regulated basic protein FbpA [Scopulibacillus cellulosilyticus]|uniref:Fur-regulated basic protein FbpA n=1 Tax=Scopulibacillus cellulosilyticus TaxID=2665665 RepID=A0ABW2PYK6_9BACL
MTKKPIDSNQKDTYIQRLLNKGIFKINDKQLYEYTKEQLKFFYEQGIIKDSKKIT